MLANGPVRVVFELAYAYDAVGSEPPVSETKRFTLDAGHNLDEIESTFSVELATQARVTAAIGLAKHKKNIESAEPVTKDEQGGWMSLWEHYGKNGELGTAVLLPAGALAGFAEDEANHLVLVKAKTGQPVRYYAGAGWTRSGDFADKASWEKSLADFAARLKSPLRVAYPDAN